MSASGFTKNMDQFLLHELGMVDSIEEGSGEESDFYENENDEVEHLAERVAELMKEESSEVLGNSTVPPAKEMADNVKSESEEYVSLSENDDCESVASKVCYSDIHSVRSMSTATTIPPEVIRDRVKKALAKRERAAVRHRNLAKGEASAVNRQRRDNKDTIKDSFGIWG